MAKRSYSDVRRDFIARTKNKRAVLPDTGLTKSQQDKLTELERSEFVVTGWHLGARGPILNSHGQLGVLSRHGKLVWL